MTAASLKRDRKETVEKLDFDFNTPDNTIIKILPKNRRIRSVSIIYDIDFDDVATVISIGTSTDNNQFIDANENDPTETDGEFNKNSNFFDISNQTTIRFFIAPGTSSQGAGTVYIKYI